MIVSSTDGFWAIVLAAGESKRMGCPKMLLPFFGKTMIENVIDNISGSRLRNILVVVGSEKDSIIEVAGKRDLKFCFNEHYKEGMLSSVKCGFSNLPPDFEAVLVFQGDQPLISKEVVNLVITAYMLSGKGIVIPVYNLKRGHPLLISRKYLDEVKSINSEMGLNFLSQKFGNDVLEIETNESGILKDIDTYQEYLLEINKTQ